MFSRRDKYEGGYPSGVFDLAKENREFASRLRNGPRHHPSHAKVKLPELDSTVAKFGGLSGVMWAFKHFEGYADFVNGFADPNRIYDIGPWVLERRESPDLALTMCDGPNFGLRYSIYYNDVMVGDVELDPMSEEFREQQEKNSCFVTVEINPAPFIPYRHLRGLLSICSEPFGGRDRLISINEAIQDVLWEVNRTGTQWARLSFRYCGECGRLRVRPTK